MWLIRCAVMKNPNNCTIPSFLTVAVNSISLEYCTYKCDKEMQINILEYDIGEIPDIFH